jgi:hypothetical protein
MNLDKIREKVKAFFNLVSVEKPLMSEDQMSTVHNKIEYMHFNRSLTLRQLNALGDSGWELVSHSVAVGDREVAQYYVFKRDKK